MVMEKRYQDQVWARLDSLYANGTTFISWGEIYHWYDLKRIAKTPWRDLLEKWKELLLAKKEKFSDVQVAEVRGGVSLFFSRNPGRLSKLAE